MIETLLSRTEAALREGVDRRWHSAAAVSVVRPDRMTDIAVGNTLDGDPMSTEHLLPWFCAAKPLVVLALARAVSAGALGWDDPVARHVPAFGRSGKESVTVRHVLRHCIGILTDPVEYVGLPTAAALRVIHRTPVQSGWIPGREHSYLPFTSWYLLGAVLAEVDGRPLGEVLREDVIGPLGLHDTWVAMTPEEHTRLRPRLAGVGTRQVRGDPARHQFRLDIDGLDTCGDAGPLSVRGTTADLARLYATLAFGGPVLGIAEPVWDELVCRPAEPVYDHRHQVMSVLGMGLVFEGREIGEASRVFGPQCSADTMGHRGLGSVVGYADRKAGIAVAQFFDTTIQALGNRARIDAVSAAVYEDLEVW